MDPEQMRGAGDGAERSTDPDADQLLLARVAAGDAEALAVLYARHQRSLAAYISLIAGDKGLAEELLQDTVLAVWKGASRFCGRSSVRSWMLGIARRRSHDALRRHTFHVISMDEVEPESLPSVTDPADLLLASSASADLAAAISHLVPAHREVLALVFVYGMSYRDVADVLGVPVGTVKSRLHAAKQALRALLDAEVGDVL